MNKTRTYNRDSHFRGLHWSRGIRSLVELFRRSRRCLCGQRRPSAGQAALRGVATPADLTPTSRGIGAGAGQPAAEGSVGNAHRFPADSPVQGQDCLTRKVGPKRAACMAVNLSVSRAGLVRERGTMSRLLKARKFLGRRLLLMRPEFLKDGMFRAALSAAFSIRRRGRPNSLTEPRGPSPAMTKSRRSWRGCLGARRPWSSSSLPTGSARC